MAINFNALVDGAYKISASDIHLVDDSPVFLRIDGVMRPVENTQVATEDIQTFLKEIMPTRLEETLRSPTAASIASGDGIGRQTRLLKPRPRPPCRSLLPLLART